MSTFIHHELLLLVQTIAAGAVLLLCYDLLIAIRNVFVHSDKAAGAEDLLYWLCCAFFVFSEIYRTNEGILRLFMVLGFLLGAYACHKTIGDISQRMLTVTLRTLESDGLVERKIYAQVPPKVEYNLTSTGHSLIPHVEALVEWALEYMPVILKNRMAES